MFERYTERARRVIFFGRYEASKFESTAIESEHLLLGLIREDWRVFEQFLSKSISVVQVRDEIEKLSVPQRGTSTSAINLPLTSEVKRILGYAAEEADHLGHVRIGTELLLLGIMREEHCLAAKILSGLGLELKAIRETTARTPESNQDASSETAGSDFRRFFLPLANMKLPVDGVVPDAVTAKRIAEAVWLPRFKSEQQGKTESVAAQSAELKYGVWTVIGSRTTDTDQSVLVAFIQKADARILRLHQEQAGA
ncbi:MAG TPA: Clp protease N-terminal domain-containing protein [Terriglobia bacterium]|nr:Clp protease N-terminal domain-containing protein [Terriglobia bacterium]